MGAVLVIAVGVAPFASLLPSPLPAVIARHLGAEAISCIVLKSILEQD